MQLVFKTHASRNACWDVNPVWVILSASKAINGATYVRNHDGAFRMGIEDYALPTEQYRLSFLYRTLTSALLRTLNLAINDFQDRVYGGPIDPA